MRVEPEHRSDEVPSEPPGPVAVQEGTDRPAGETPDDGAALADVDGGEFPPEPGEAGGPRPEAGHATEDPWLRSENTAADEFSIGEPAADEPAVGVASVPSPREASPLEDVPSPREASPLEDAPEASSLEDAPEASAGSDPAAATGTVTEQPAFGFPSGDGAAAREEAAIRDTTAAREAAAERDEAAEEPDRPSDADLMTEAASGSGQAVEDTEPAYAEVGEPAAAPVSEPVAAEDTGSTEDAAAEPEELAPGEVPVTAVAVLWEAETVDGYRDRWQQLQLRFIDDPRQATEQAQALVADVFQGLTEALERHRGELDRWRGAQLDDTEELRMAVRRYRDLLDRLLGL